MGNGLGFSFFADKLMVKTFMQCFCNENDIFSYKRTHKMTLFQNQSEQAADFTLSHLTIKYLIDIISM